MPVTIGLLATACGGDGVTDDGSAGADAGAPAIVATTTIWADITSHVACGEPVVSLVPAGADPHSYEPSLRDRELVAEAALVVANGAGLESTTEPLLDAAIDDGVDVVEVAPHVDLLDGGEHEEGEHEDGAGDPHVWQDPTRVAVALEVIASALSAAGYDTCEANYRDELLALDAEITDILAVVPSDDRLLVTSHDSLAYFADRYDFEIVGAVIPSTSTMADSSAGELAELAELVEERSVRALFTDAFESAGDAEALAGRIGIPVVALVTDALTDDAATYAALMRSNATTIAGALAP
jgi:zinc/manganese transport system substrate-binding protein